MIRYLKRGMTTHVNITHIALQIQKLARYCITLFVYSHITLPHMLPMYIRMGVRFGSKYGRTTNTASREPTVL